MILTITGAEMWPVIIGALLTLIVLSFLGMMTFFLGRLVNQLDRATANIDTLALNVAKIEARVSSLEHRTQVVSVSRTEGIPSNAPPSS